MKKFILFCLLSIFAASLFGCSDKNIPKQDLPSAEQPSQQPAGNPAPLPSSPSAPDFQNIQPSLAGIKRGDSMEQVINTLGSNYSQTIFDDYSSLGEPFKKLKYSTGVEVVLGSNTGKVLEITTTSPDTTTNLGFKVGDKAQDVLVAYRAKYSEPNSRHEDTKLIGWFIIKDQDLIIFNLGQKDSLGNTQIKPDAKIERIIITNFNYMD